MRLQRLEALDTSIPDQGDVLNAMIPNCSGWQMTDQLQRQHRSYMPDLVVRLPIAESIDIRLFSGITLSATCRYPFAV